MISKKLLSVVLERDATEPTLEKHNMIEYLDWSNNGCGVAINIYELAYRCRDWARSFGYEIYITEIQTKTLFEAIILKGSLSPREGGIESRYYPKEDSEPEAIFKACEWILKQY